MRRASLADLLAEHPFADDEPLLHTVDVSVLAGEVRSRAAAIAARLRDAGVGAGEGVAVRLGNDPEGVVAMFGTWMAGAVLVPLNPRSPDAEVAHVLATLRPAATLEGERVEPLDDPARDTHGTAFVTWTSGTTGMPKPIRHTHAGYLELLDRVLGGIRGGASGTRSERPTPNLIPVSLALNAGVYNVLFGLRAGAALVLMDRFETATFATLVRRFAIRSTVLPPAAMTMLNDDPSVTDLSPLRYVRSITAPLSPLQARRLIERFGVVVLNSYGQAELGEVIGWSAADAKAYPDKLGAAGRPHAGVDVKLVDGELFVRTANAAVGLAPDRVDGDGFVATGDLARIDEDGFVWIEGRVGDVINRGGAKVVPTQVEEVLRLSPAVVDAAVAGAPDDRLGEVPVAFVVLRDGATLDTESLEGLCREHLTPYKVPVAFHAVGELPRTEVGKVLRRRLVEGLRA